MLLFEKTPQKVNRASQGNRLFPGQRSSHLSERRGRRQAIRRDQTRRDRRHEKKKKSVEGARSTTRVGEEENSIKGAIEGEGS